MIILVGGSSCSGKTYLAQRLLEKLKITYLSLDHLKMGLIRSNHCSFLAIDDDSTIEIELWPITLGIIETNIENKQNIIIEGCYLPHKEIYKLRNKYPNQIEEYYLILSKNYILKHFEDGILRYRNVIENRLYDEDRSIEEIIEENTKQKQLCLQYDLSYIEIENNYSKEISKVLNSIGD